MRPLRVLFAPDSFKGSFSSIEIARALAAGWSRARPNDVALFAPLADGGEGTLAAVEAAGGWLPVQTGVIGPLGEEVAARWLISTDGKTAVIEMAQASGLSLVPLERRDPMAATSVGTGMLVEAALDRDVRRIVLGLGGSATTDGGLGMLLELGGPRMPPSGQVDFSVTDLDPRLALIDVRVACDVTNPLLGPDGAAAVYGPQKGATTDQVRVLDEMLSGWADVLEAATGRRERATPGAGAAGGLGFALLCIQDRFRSFALQPGVDLIMEATGFDARLADADLVITGEGRIDFQTAFGKTALGVARRAAVAGVPCVAVGGGVTHEGMSALGDLVAAVMPVIEAPMTVQKLISLGADPIERAGERIARLVSLGGVLGG